MTDLLLIGLGAFIGVGLSIPAYCLGLFTYAHVYGTFKARMEDQVKARLAAFEQSDRTRNAKVTALAEKVKRSYGGLPQEHQEVVAEEVERILSGGPHDE